MSVFIISYLFDDGMHGHPSCPHARSKGKVPLVATGVRHFDRVSRNSLHLGVQDQVNAVPTTKRDVSAMCLTASFIFRADVITVDLGQVSWPGCYSDCTSNMFHSCSNIHKMLVYSQHLAVSESNVV